MPTLIDYVLAYGAWMIGVVPFAWLGFLAWRGQRRDVAWYWLAAAFFVSWIADGLALASHESWLMSLVYPVSQGAIVSAVLLDRDEAWTVVQVLALTAIASAIWHDVNGPDVLLHTVAGLTVTGIVLDRPALGRLRLALLVAFGLGTVAWWGFVLRPDYDHWRYYQGVRLMAALTFCWSAWKPAPRLKLVFA